MKEKILILFCILGMMSCTEEEEHALVISWACKINLRLQSLDGIDLLNRKNEGHYRDSEIEIPETGSTASVKHSFDYYYLTLHLNYPTPYMSRGELYHEEMITKLRFGDNEPDIIKALYKLEYHKSDNEEILGGGSGYIVTLQQAWFNGVEVYEIQAAENKDWEYPIVVKTPNTRQRIP